VPEWGWARKGWKALAAAAQPDARACSNWKHAKKMDGYEFLRKPAARLAGGDPAEGSCSEQTENDVAHLRPGAAACRAPKNERTFMKPFSEQGSRLEAKFQELVRLTALTVGLFSVQSVPFASSPVRQK